MTSVLRSTAAALALLLALIAGPPALAAGAPVGQLTILISIDGFRADYLDRTATAPPALPGAAPPGPVAIPLVPVAAPSLTPNIAALALDGVRATAMHPSYPVLTYPNHHAMVTGLRPDRSGIVDNHMEDARRPGVHFSTADRAVVTDPFWWNESEPIWVTAERVGVRTAAEFWPGSELPIRGIAPRDWKPYDKKVPANQRVDQALAWLKAPADQRPRFIALYFDEVDTAGHAFGPDAPELNAALTRTDAAIGRLVAALKARKLYATTNLILVSDHGMAPASAQRVTYLDALLPAGSFRAVSLGQSAGVVPLEGHDAEVAKVLLAKRPHMTCWRKGDIPKRLHYGSNPRIPPYVCLGQTGWSVMTHAYAKAHPIKRGAHGFDPDDPLMNALFVAEGPAFRKGAIQPAFDNVDIYPLLARLIGVAPLANDGNLADLAPSLTY